MGKKISGLAIRIVPLLLFLLVAIATLYLAYGYRFDFQLGDVKKTSIIDISADIKDVELTLDAEFVATNLPYQIKNITPGKYKLEVKKEGFHSWSREVLVKEDIVSIVRDVLLVPEDLTESTLELHTFSNEEQVEFFNYHGLSFIPKDREMVLFSFLSNGRIRQEVIEFYRDFITSVVPLNGDKFLVHYLNGGFAYVSFSDGQFESFYLPDKAQNLKVDSRGSSIYFIKDENLYRIPFSMLPEESDETDLLLFKIRDNVEVFDLGFDDDVYYISEGMIYRSDLYGNNVSLINKEKADYKNLDFEGENNFGYLITRDTNDKRALNLIDKSGDTLSLTKDLKGKPYFNNFDRIIYSDNKGGIYFYDPFKEKEIFVTEIQDDFAIIGWFTDFGHFILDETDSIKLMDIYNSNQYTLLEGNMEVVAVTDKTIYYLEDSTLYSLNWQRKFTTASFF